MNSIRYFSPASNRQHLLSPVPKLSKDTQTFSTIQLSPTHPSTQSLASKGGLSSKMNMKNDEVSAGKSQGASECLDNSYGFKKTSS